MLVVFFGSGRETLATDFCAGKNPLVAERLRVKRVGEEDSEHESISPKEFDLLHSSGEFIWRVATDNDERILTDSQMLDACTSRELFVLTLTEYEQVKCVHFSLKQRGLIHWTHWIFIHADGETTKVPFEYSRMNVGDGAQHNYERVCSQVYNVFSNRLQALHVSQAVGAPV